jgi:hypothetical protein
VTQALVQQAQALGLKVIPWTINQAADMERLIGWGVDGLITDYPDRLREIFAPAAVAAATTPDTPEKLRSSAPGAGA